MKTKRIVALALIAAMTISTIGSTAFAATAKWKEFVQTTESSDKKKKTTFWAVVYKTGNNGSWKYYVLQEADLTVEEEATSGEIKVVKTVSIPTQQVKGDNDAVVLFSEIKNDLKMPANDPESDFKVVGWELGKQSHKAEKETALPVDASEDTVKAAIVADDVNIADTTYGIPTKVRAFYPVYQKKNTQDKIKDAQEIAGRPKIARIKGDKGEWKYTEQEIKAIKSADKASEDSGKEDCEKCNTTTGKSLVFDVKPVAKENNKEVELRVSHKPRVEVILPVGKLLTEEERDWNIDKQVNKLSEQISKKKDNRLKVFHIGNDGLSHPVSFEVVKAKPTSATSGEAEQVCVKFKYGYFSDFVVTRDKDAKAQAGKERASSGNPATGEASALPVALLALASLSATGVVVYKKRKAE